MFNPFFDHPILYSPYESPVKHWELDGAGQPTQKIIERRRNAKFITPIPKPKKRKWRTVSWQMSMPRSASRSSTFRSDSGYFTYNNTARRMISGELLKYLKGLLILRP